MMLRSRMLALLKTTNAPWKWTDPEKLSELPEHSWKTQIDPEALDQITQSMRNQGWYGPPIVTMGESHQVIDGRHRALAAQKTETRVPVINISEAEFEKEARVGPMRSLEQIAQAVIEKGNK